MSTLVKTNGLLPTNSFFDDFFTKDLFDFGWNDRNDRHALVPRVNIIETNDEFRVQMAAPGMKKNDFKIELDNDVLTITSDLPEEENKKDIRYIKKEFNYGNFKRSFYLPNIVEKDQIEASYSEGILNLTIPKVEEARKKPSRTITVA